ncbi:thioredoxin family protein [Winogradskyella sp.]|nr:thioredoxin family protein [Winogradskyella sp.]MDC1230097.1 thioredoxin family protein [bacterium]MDB9755853.1 thioredoxin family protein [Winogradskyella sp.]MDB9782141.1 thioredoxin family protein [Winogradskyella sp.]MDC0006798.1 thioredoxin family protein [Winogradskyella sp.]
MKKIILILLTLWFQTALVNAQQWETDFETAKEIALKENKVILLVFQGSDWCAPCIKMDKEIWSKDEFIAHAKVNYVMLKADFPRRKKNALSERQTKSNVKLAETYNKYGYFPFVVIIDHKGDILGEASYKKTTVSSYISILDAFIK